MSVKGLVKTLSTSIFNSSRAQRMFWQSLLTALVFYFGRYLADTAEAAFKSNPIPSYFFHAIIFTSIFAITVFLFRFILHHAEKFEEKVNKQRSTKAHAYALCDRTLLTEIKKVENSVEDDPLFKKQLENIQSIIDDTYTTFESAYGLIKKFEPRIDFEVTLMSKSKKDDLLTIIAAANKDSRSPKSLQLRDSDPHIYDRTISADVHRSPSPRITIIPSTSADSYSELYPEQKRRIRSSVIFPVLTPSNSLLGTLVVHCDKEYFFLLEDEKYMTDLLDVFAKRLAKELIIIKRDYERSDRKLHPY